MLLIFEQLSKQDHAKKAIELNSSTVRSRLAELESSHQNNETENAQLRRDKMLLVDHVADLQKKVRIAFCTMISKEFLQWKKLLGNFR